jgi:hypothetical protein
MRLISLNTHLLKVNILWAELIYKRDMKMHTKFWWEDLLKNSAWRTEGWIETRHFFFFLLFGLWGYWHCGHSWPIVPASGDNEDDSAEADGM